jgi:hypothetical protein
MDIDALQLKPLLSLRVYGNATLLSRMATLQCALLRSGTAGGLDGVILGQHVLGIDFYIETSENFHNKTQLGISYPGFKQLYES